MAFTPDGRLLAATRHRRADRADRVRGPAAVWRTIVHEGGGVAARRVARRDDAGQRRLRPRGADLADRRPAAGAGPARLGRHDLEPAPGRRTARGIATAGEDRLIRHLAGRRRRPAPDARRPRAQHLDGPLQPRFAAAGERQLRSSSPPVGRRDRPAGAAARRPRPGGGQRRLLARRPAARERRRRFDGAALAGRRRRASWRR